MPALRRSAPTVRFMALETLVTGVRAFECAFKVRTSSFVHGLIARRAFSGALVVFAIFDDFFATLGIQTNSNRITTRLIWPLWRDFASVTERQATCSMIEGNEHAS
jgi:hypothetical protein